MTNIHCIAASIDGPAGWAADWAWGVPLIVLTVVIHVLGLTFIREKMFRISQRGPQRQYNALFATVLATTTLLVTLLHGAEAAIWAAAYRLVHALPDNRSALLYSINAITSYGHTNLDLGQHWYLLGALEALNGWLLFGLTTAFLFTVIERFRPTESRDQTPRPVSASG